MWSRLAWKTGEMAIASAQVIGHRTSRLALAGSVPSARDQREFALMGQEKGEAAMESAQAVGVRMLMLNQQFAALAFKQMLSASASADVDRREPHRRRVCRPPIEARARYDDQFGRCGVKALRLHGPARTARVKTCAHARQRKCQATRQNVQVAFATGRESSPPADRFFLFVHTIGESHGNHRTRQHSLDFWNVE